VRAQCELLVGQEVQLLASTQSWDANELEMARNDARWLDHEVEALELANQIESVHLADHRAEQLTRNLSQLGCQQTLAEVKEKLIAQRLGAE
jgi:hypothetical protein